MPFNKNDIYTSSGSVKLYNAWTPYVSKYDTSSFYNWEQDNLPLYDLEERTYELWEQAGFATSAGVPGLALTVSADAPASVLAANRNVFTTLSGCIAAIPKVVRFPVLVEVANFGDMGNLELHNFRIEEGGSIEIINRGFARILSTSSYNLGAAITAATYNASNRLVSQLASVHLKDTLIQTSCVNIETLLLSAVPESDTRLNSGSNCVLSIPHPYRSSTLSVFIDRDLTDGTDLFVSQDVFEYVGDATDQTLSSLDVSATRQSDLSLLASRPFTNNRPLTGCFYTNSVRKISVKNCDGPIYIRNFFVDGKTSTSNGIEIVNSDVLLEHCASVRCKEAGFKFNNSKVILSRSAYAYRNYTLSGSSARVPEVGYGFHAVNSDITLSSILIDLSSTSVGDNGASACEFIINSSKNYAGFVLDNSKLKGGISRTINTNASSASVLAAECNTGYGMLLTNSEVNLKGLLDIYYNNRGIDADGSRITFEELCVDTHSNEGILATNSTFIWNSEQNPTSAGQSERRQCEFRRNSQHIKLLNNCYFGFNKKNSIPQKYGNSFFNLAHGVVSWDGANKSTLPSISVNNNSTLELLHPSIRVDNLTDSISNSTSYGRAIRASNSSTASLFGSQTGCTHIIGPAGIDYQKRMAGLYADNNSTINIHGPTAMLQFGVDALVENNSVLNIRPATVQGSKALDVSGFDLSSGANHTHVELHSTRACLVANKNSTIHLQDLGSFPKNWNRTANGQAYLALGYDYPTDSFGTSAYTASGSLQFYPNPQDDTVISNNLLDNVVAGLPYTIPDFPTFNTGEVFTRIVNDTIINSTPTWASRAKVTLGGTCVRATEDSIVNVKNVHFPVGSNGSELDGFYYNASGSECDKLMIWNIADTSRLNASYLSVSGMHPSDSRYHGPSSIWLSSNGVPASAAPSGTPDTGALSILDIFGAGSGIWTIGAGISLNSPFNRFYPINTALGEADAKYLYQAGISTYVPRLGSFLIGAPVNTSRNQGVFRIYWTPKASARALQMNYAGSSIVGAPYQIFAQGYNCSGPLSSIVPTGETNASSLFPDLLKLQQQSTFYTTDIHTSGFYYCSEFVEDNPTQCLLDESAAKTFANAQNASVGWAGRPSKVSIHRAYSAENDRLSESRGTDTSGSVGFKSASIFDLSRDN
jgi:hypothetical protein